MTILKTEWNRLNNELICTRYYFLLSLSHYSLFLALKKLLKSYCKGSVLDAGAGKLAWRKYIKESASNYTSIDKYGSHKELDALCDISATPYEDCSFDTVFCSQVIEHTPEPGKILKELFRVLKPDGTLILTAPHLSYLHGEPEDYYRYTKYGLKYLLEKESFEVISIEPTSGLISFIFTIPSIIFVSLTYAYLRPVWPVFFYINALFVKLFMLFDGLLGLKRLYALDYVAVARK